MSLSYNYLEYLVKIKATVRVKETKNSQDLVAKSYLLLTNIGKADTIVLPAEVLGRRDRERDTPLDRGDVGGE